MREVINPPQKSPQPPLFKIGGEREIIPFSKGICCGNVWTKSESFNG